jgi:hypothetical protein
MGACRSLNTCFCLIVDHRCGLINACRKSISPSGSKKLLVGRKQGTQGTATSASGKPQHRVLVLKDCSVLEFTEDSTSNSRVRSMNLGWEKRHTSLAKLSKCYPAIEFHASLIDDQSTALGSLLARHQVHGVAREGVSASVAALPQLLTNAEVAGSQSKPAAAKLAGCVHGQALPDAASAATQRHKPELAAPSTGAPAHERHAWIDDIPRERSLERPPPALVSWGQTSHHRTLLELVIWAWSTATEARVCQQVGGRLRWMACSGRSNPAMSALLAGQAQWVTIPPRSLPSSYFISMTSSQSPRSSS